MKPKARFLAACRKEPVDCTPVWFMRQAGRFLPEYREIRKNYSVLEAAKTPEISSQITLLPVKELGVDAAVMFADIMLPLEGMGVGFQIEENIGPIVSSPIRNLLGAQNLGSFEPHRDVSYVLEAIKRVKAKLDESGHALVGFSGAPFTIASYLIEGKPSRDFMHTKKLMYDDREAWNLLMSKIADMVAKYLSSQIEAGVDAVQLFDSWIGALSTRDYEEFVVPYVERIFRDLESEHSEVPKIHFGTNTRHLLQLMKQRNCGDVFSVDWKMTITEARSLLGKETPIQGNLEPAVLLVSDEQFLACRTQQVLDDNGGDVGHIFNLGHGILKDTPVDSAKFVVNYVHENS
jgi:uroporphyrinogen decarboxylase